MNSTRLCILVIEPEFLVRMLVHERRSADSSIVEFSNDSGAAQTSLPSVAEFSNMPPHMVLRSLVLLRTIHQWTT